ncbi:RES family NAD+ phosphorylase [Thalassospira sp. TSL5-1]|uniref:RES family NAD+ phosphorylase n=1 Tax=Thalassospira sp. TSL5-1 TaxID=1544451 RepID=UPI00093E1A9B|nr:RES family NAD+ phosphorylase [Thalassospira sp. TSL5-1]OKH86736.1 RES domain-containing protein [Thalassospira sp. TSL5-1]
MLFNDNEIFHPVQGLFYRAIDPHYRANSLAGSRNAGRYSQADQPTLYLSSSPEGVTAAMIAHRTERPTNLEMITVSVDARRIFDLRDEKACEMAGITLQDATTPWQDLVAQGKTPPSWRVRDKLAALGAQGLIDPSRKAPGLWHLVLFHWNTGPQQPTVKVVSR